MRAVAVATCLAAVLAADPSGFEVVSDSSAVVPVTTLRGAATATEGAVSVEGTDPTCAGAEVILQKLVEVQCGVSDVSCVYKMDGDCDDWCSPSTQCGYIQDNALMKFHDFDCSITATSVLPPRVDGTIKCKPSFTTAGVLAILAAVVLGLACCGGCTWWCCCRSRR
jgi:hypothetical protein